LPDEVQIEEVNSVVRRKSNSKIPVPNHELVRFDTFSRKKKIESKILVNSRQGSHRQLLNGTRKQTPGFVSKALNLDELYLSAEEDNYAIGPFEH
jgi:hypothetical protein